MLKIQTYPNYDAMSAAAAEMIAMQILQKPNSILGLATGSTPEGLYSALVGKFLRGQVDFSGVTSVNLDEYYPISPDNEQSYRYFMNQKLFNLVNINKGNTYVPDGTAADGNAEAGRYEALVDSLGQVDIQVLGIGRNGHIGFNEPGDALIPATHVTKLTDSTIEANARFFASKGEVPTRALTMGIGTILKAKEILLLVSGKEKHDALMRLMEGRVTTECPATFLLLHPNVTVLCDTEAYDG